MIDFKDILETCQIEAIANRLIRTDESIWRSMCRSYSEAFHTPLYLVLDMDPEHVILNVYEKQADNLNIEDYQKLEHLLDTIRSIEDPSYEIAQKDEQSDFDRKAEEEEAERIKAGRPVYDPKKRLSKNMKDNEKERPTGGSVDLSHLSKQDSES